MFTIDKILRENIKNIKPYSSARDEYTGTEGIFLDANENPIGSVVGEKYNRYPDPLQRKIKDKLSVLKSVNPAQIFLGNGSDEGIDLLFRAFCRPGIDNIIIMPPTYGMYQVCADINDVEIRSVNLTDDYHLKVDEILKAVDENTKAIFVCSPNNPTGNSFVRADIKRLLTEFEGIVVVDEAYIDFSNEESFVSELVNFPNLLVLQTFSKAWGMAALRIGMAFASEEIIKVFNRIKYPYNVNEATQQLTLEALDLVDKKNTMVANILSERSVLQNAFEQMKTVKKVYPSDANFLLIKIEKAHQLYNFLVENLIIVRDRSKVVLCDDCLRITIGTKDENKELLAIIKNFN